MTFLSICIEIDTSGCQAAAANVTIQNKKYEIIWLNRFLLRQKKIRLEKYMEQLTWVFCFISSLSFSFMGDFIILNHKET